MNVHFADTTNAADDAAAVARQRADDLIRASAGMDPEEARIILGIKPMERKFSTRTKIVLGVGSALGVAGLLAAGVMSENKLGVVNKVVGAAHSVYNTVTGFFGGVSTSA